MKISQIIKLFQKEGFLTGLSPARLRTFVQESNGCNPSELEEHEAKWAAFSVLEQFYVDDKFEQGLRDGYIMHSWKFGKETDDVVAELSMMLGSPPMYVQESMGDNVLNVTRDDGEHEEIHCSGGFDDVVQFFNKTLEQRGATKKFYEVDSGSDPTYFCLTEHQYKTLSKIFYLPTEPSKDDASKKLMAEPITDGWQYLRRAEGLQKLYKDELALDDYMQIKFSQLKTETLSERISVLKGCLSKTKLLYAAKRFSDCIEACSDILPTCTDKDSMFRAGRDLILYRGRAYIELGKIEDAMNDFDTLIADNEWDADAYYYRAVACKQKGDEANAEEGLAKATELGCKMLLL